jgi:ParB-like chromosome segregation protein Spo0J
MTDADAWKHNELQVHPLCAMFPWLPDDEMASFVESVRELGLLEPICLTHDGLVIDGKIRLEACRRAGVEPRFRTLGADEDLPAFAMSANLLRKHLSKGQRAMAHAFAYPDPEKGGRGRKAVATEDLGDVSAGFISHARTVRRENPESALAVLKGELPLENAYTAVLEERAWVKLQAERRGRLQAAAPDLLDRVQDETLTLNEAEAELQAREDLAADRRRNAAAAAEQFATLLAILQTWEGADPKDAAEQRLELLRHDGSLDLDALTANRCRYLARVLDEIAGQMEP